MSFNHTYRVPAELAVTPTTVRRVLLVGSCLAIHWPEHIFKSEPGCHCDYVIYNNAAMLPESPPQPVSEYDFQIIQLPLRTIIPDGAFVGLDYQDVESYQRLFDTICNRLSVLLDEAMRWNRSHGLLSFVTNFLVPQQANTGRLLQRYDIRNFQHFVERLNMELERYLGTYSGAYIVDVDGITADLGKRSLQDDVVWADNHASFISDFEFEKDQGRITPVKRVSEIYPVQDRPLPFMESLWAEMLGMFRTIKRIDAVKLIIFDLDDTLWRGILAEKGEISGLEMEGWPLGVVDALITLKRRGIMLAIASKNDEAVIRAQWRNTFGHRLSLGDFVAVKINWRSKVENVQEILDEVNVLPDSVVFIDDNPVERNAISQSFPTLRTVAANPYTLKRVLVWSPEVQVREISLESSRRTEMIQGQTQREVARKRMSRAEFLDSLQIRVDFDEIWSAKHPRFLRALELINKTNQFNTTSRRWSDEEASSALERGVVFLTWSVADSFSEYGLVGVAIIEGDMISQFVMSCRVFGLDIEKAAISRIVQRAVRVNQRQLRAKLIRTSANSPCQQLFEQSGFILEGDEWLLSLPCKVEMPGHVTIAAV